MSDYKTKEGQGALFANNNKKTDKHPDYTGRLMVDGKLKSVSGWINTSKSGATKYMSLKIDDYKPKEQTMGYTTTAPDNAEVPF